MSRDQRQKAKGRSSKPGRFAMLPRSALQSPAIASLSHLQFRVLTVAAAECNGGNNGDLALVRGVLERYGLSDTGGTQDAIRELQVRGLLIKTRQGGLGRCSLYALPWFGLMGKTDKLDRPLPTLPDMLFMKWQPGEKNARPLSGRARTADRSFDPQPPPSNTPQRTADRSFERSHRTADRSPSKTLPQAPAKAPDEVANQSALRMPFSRAAPIDERTRAAIVKSIQAGEDPRALALAFNIPETELLELKAKARGGNHGSDRP